MPCCFKFSSKNVPASAMCKNTSLGIKASLYSVVKVGGKSLIIITTEYKDTLMPSEVFLHMADAGTFLEENLKQQGIDVSFQLQHGMNLKKFVEKGLGVKSAEIYGSVSGYPYINQCSSLRSLLSKIYGIEYLGMKELADMPPVKSE